MYYSNKKLNSKKMYGLRKDTLTRRSIYLYNDFKMNFRMRRGIKKTCLDYNFKKDTVKRRFRCDLFTKYHYRQW